MLGFSPPLLTLCVQFTRSPIFISVSSSECVMLGRRICPNGRVKWLAPSALIPPNGEIPWFVICRTLDSADRWPHQQVIFRSEPAHPASPSVPIILPTMPCSHCQSGNRPWWSRAKLYGMTIVTEPLSRHGLCWLVEKMLQGETQIVDLCTSGYAIGQSMDKSCNHCITQSESVNTLLKVHWVDGSSLVTVGNMSGRISAWSLSMDGIARHVDGPGHLSRE